MPNEPRAAKKAAPDSLLSGYEPGADAYDELLAENGEPRESYLKMLVALQQLGAPERARRWDACLSLIHDQGISYNVYGDPRGMERPWQIDPLPLVIAPDEWHALANGLIQRAKLLNLILADCYGAQELIRSGWLSPALVFAQPDFLRPCHGVPVPKDLFLHFYAADLARAPVGICVRSDTTHHRPSGERAKSAA